MKLGRRPTGELKVFEACYERQRGRCAITGDSLLPPGAMMFHAQGSHMLPKGYYRRGRLWHRNVIMILFVQHDKWTNTGDKWELVTGRGPDRTPGDERWRLFVELYEYLRLCYNTIPDYDADKDPDFPFTEPGYGMRRRSLGQCETPRSTGGCAPAGGNNCPGVQDDDLPF